LGEKGSESLEFSLCKLHRVPPGRFKVGHGGE
jgi:hypothetical protein